MISITYNKDGFETSFGHIEKISIKVKKKSKVITVSVDERGNIRID